MKISPEPLAPLRNWRELWKVETLGSESPFTGQVATHLEAWKQPKRSGFSWFAHLFSRTAHR